MTLLPLAYDFPLMTPPVDRGADKPPLILSHRQPWAVPIADMCGEIGREIEYRTVQYPKWVAQNRMSQAEADSHLDVLDEIHRDLTGFAPDPEPGAPPRWDAKVRELRREIALRRNSYPSRIAAGRMREADAAPHMEAIEAAHWHYSVKLEHWDEVPHLPEAEIRALCAHGHASSIYTAHRACHPNPGACPGWEAANAPRAAIRTRAAAIDAWIWQAHQSADPAVTGYLSPDQIAWHQAQQQRQAA